MSEVAKSTSRDYAHLFDSVPASSHVISEIDRIAGSNKAISLRMNLELIESLKFIAKGYNVGYQTLIKHVLQRFVDNEKDYFWSKQFNSSEEQVMVCEQEQELNVSHG